MPNRSVRLPLALLLAAGAPLTGQARLPEVRIAGKTACEVHPETAAATADLWLIARSTLEAAAIRDSAPPELLIEEWRNTLGPNLRTRWERRDTTRVATNTPFEKKTPGNLERAGYIQVRRETLVYYGPGAELLLSERFLRRHCFTRIAGAGPSAGLVGLGFAPLPSQDLTDVTGVLWIDPAARELRHVEYVWTNPPLEARAPASGGRADFARLADGGWIIQRWNIRMPRPTDVPGTGFGGYTDQGGAVLAVGARRRP